MIISRRNFLFSMGFAIFIPFILGRSINPKSGIACSYYFPEDLTNVNWFHFWGPANSDPRCVPMSYMGDDPNLSPDYSGYLIVFNEPDVDFIYSGYIIPTDAAVRYNALATKYPNAKMIVGNTTHFGVNWLREFKGLCNKLPYAWGIHMYSDNVIFFPKDLINQMEYTHNEIGGTFWFTEWADAYGIVEHDQILLDWLNATAWVEKWAYFTNRSYGNEAWWLRGWKPQLWTMDGILTDVGQWWLENI